MFESSRTFNPDVQRGRFYMDAHMVAESGACFHGLQRYIGVFGEKRVRFTKAAIRKAVENNLLVYYFAEKADALYNTGVDDRFMDALNAWSDERPHDPWAEPTKKEIADMWIEAFTHYGYI